MALPQKAAIPVVPQRFFLVQSGADCCAASMFSAFSALVR
jgi:hypothetical protein